MAVALTFDANILYYALDSEGGEEHLLAADLLRAAVRAGCTLLLSEDGQHGRIFNGVTVVNPFLLAGPELHRIFSSGSR